MACGMLRLAAVPLLLAAGEYPPTPYWEPTWDMKMSTIIMPCNTSGWFDPAFAARYGIADFDWSNGLQQWANTAPMDCEERLVKQASMTRAINPRTKTWVYRNLVKALPWFTSVRKKLEDPAYAGWFLQFKPGGSLPGGKYYVPPCTDGKCSSAYHSQDQTPAYPSSGAGSCTEPCDCGSVPCGEYLFDHRNASLRDWLVREHVMGPLGMGNEHVFGMYLDDLWGQRPYNQSDCGAGPSEVEGHCLLDMGLREEDVRDITNGWKETQARALSAIAAAGGWAFPLFGFTGVPVQHDGCAEWLRNDCSGRSNPDPQTNAIFQPMRLKDGNVPSSFIDVESDVAHFLLVRGPHAFIGTGWVGCVPDNGPDGGGHNQTYVRPELFDRDYGVPQGLCEETASLPGVFVREWTHATVTFDCNTLKGRVAMRDAGAFESSPTIIHHFLA